MSTIDFKAMCSPIYKTPNPEGNYTFQYSNWCRGSILWFILKALMLSNHPCTGGGGVLIMRGSYLNQEYHANRSTSLLISQCCLYFKKQDMKSGLKHKLPWNTELWRSWSTWIFLYLVKPVLPILIGSPTRSQVEKVIYQHLLPELFQLKMPRNEFGTSSIQQMVSTKDMRFLQNSWICMNPSASGLATLTDSSFPESPVRERSFSTCSARDPWTEIWDFQHPGHVIAQWVTSLVRHSLSTTPMR